MRAAGTQDEGNMLEGLLTKLIVIWEMGGQILGRADVEKLEVDSNEGGAVRAVRKGKVVSFAGSIDGLRIRDGFLQFFRFRVNRGNLDEVNGFFGTEHEFEDLKRVHDAVSFPGR